MLKTKAEEVKAGFQRDFSGGELFHIWQDVEGGNGFLSRWAYHRMKVALHCIDSYGLGRSGRSLDVGIGSGRMIMELNMRGSHVYGADFSRDIIDKCREKIKGFDESLAGRIMLADVEALTMESDTFDLITCLGVFEYLSSDNRGLAELHRVLRPGGHLVLAVASYHRIGQLFNLALNKVLKRGKKKAGLQASSLKYQVRLIKPLDLRKEAVMAGFDVRNFICFGGKLFGLYLPVRLTIPGIIYIGDHCLMVLRKPLS